MARAAVKAKQAARAKAQPAAKAQRGRGRGRRGHAGGGNPNQNLFFVRLRRRQKWVFLALAIIFAATFAGVGVGSGNSADLGQIFNGLFGCCGTSVSKAQDEIKTDPKKGYQDLAQAYLAENPPDPANAAIALQSYLRLVPKDASVQLELAGLEERVAGNYVTLYQQAQQQAALAAPAQAVLPANALGQQLGTNPVDQYYAQQASSQASQFGQLATTAYNTALQAFQTVAKLEPHSANGAAAEFQVGELAQRLGQNSVALKALQQYVFLSPNTTQLVQVEQQCKSLGGICTPAYVKALHHSKK
jgi:hypothetical protein